MREKYLLFCTFVEKRIEFTKKRDEIFGFCQDTVFELQLRDSAEDCYCRLPNIPLINTTLSVFLSCIVNRSSKLCNIIYFLDERRFSRSHYKSLFFFFWQETVLQQQNIADLQRVS
jgi:hypothetical protein